MSAVPRERGSFGSNRLLLAALVTSVMAGTCPASANPSETVQAPLAAFDRNIALAEPVEPVMEAQPVPLPPALLPALSAIGLGLAARWKARRRGR